MKKIFVAYFIMIGLFFNISHAQTQTSTSALDPKTKAFLIICGYGAVGGALLGLASMAFGQESRAIAQGASVGLYGGILFGAYVIYTHNQDSQPLREDPATALPYDENYVPYNGSISPQIPYWYASSFSKLEENKVTNHVPTVSWSWQF